VTIAPQFAAPVIMLRFSQPENVLISQNAERDKRLTLPP
jgi:hypothetical protein